MTHRSSQRRACRPRGSSSGLTDLSTGPSVTSHFPVQTLSQANSNYQDPRNLEQGLLLACWTDVGPCNWAPPPLGPGLLCKLGFPGGSVGKKYACNAGEPSLIPGSGRSTGEGIGHTLQYSWAFPMAQLVKNLPAMQEALSLIPGLGRSPGQGKGYPLQYSGLENSMDCVVHGVTKSRMRLSNFHFHCVSSAKGQTDSFSD